MSDERSAALAEAFRYHENPWLESRLTERIKVVFGGDLDAFREYQDGLVEVGGPHLPWQGPNLSLYASQATTALMEAGVTLETKQYAPYISVAYILHEIHRENAWSDLLESLRPVPISYLEAARVSQFGNSPSTFQFLSDVAYLWASGFTEKYMAGLPLAFRLARSEENGFLMDDALGIQETGIDPACAAAVHRYARPEHGKDYVESCALLVDVPTDYAVALFESGLSAATIARMYADGLPLEYARAAA